jgi:putative SOS response-associated peptidase YedK
MTGERSFLPSLSREAEGIMRDIHNTKLRMAMILPKSERDAWLAEELVVASAPELEAETA